MMRRYRGIVLAMLCFLCEAIYPQKAYAYLDPGSGSFLFQLLLGVLLGAVFSMKLWWVRFKTFVTARFRRNRPPPKDHA